VRRDGLREAHCLEVHQSCGEVFLEPLSGFGQGRVAWINDHREVRRGAVIASLEDAVERCVPILKRFAVLGLLSIFWGAIAQGVGRYFFGASAQPRANVFAWYAKRHSHLVHSSNSDVDVGMFGVVMDGGNPFELRSHVALKPLHQLASVLPEVQAVSEFRRYDNFEETFVSSNLPTVEGGGDIQALFDCIEPRLGWPSSLRRALPRHIPSVCLPLAWILIRRVADPDGHALTEHAGRSGTPACPSRCFPPPIRHLHEAKHRSESACILARIFVWTVL
jgi:hypothetical protein